MSDKFILKLNSGDTAVLHTPSGDWVPVSSLGLCTLWRASKAESERDAALDRIMQLEGDMVQLREAQDAAFRDAHRAEAELAAAVALRRGIERDLGGKIAELERDATRLREALEWALSELDATPFDPDEHSQEAVAARWLDTEKARATLASVPSARAEVKP